MLQNDRPESRLGEKVSTTCSILQQLANTRASRTTAPPSVVVERIRKHNAGSSSELIEWLCYCVPWVMIMQKGCSKHEASSGSAGAIHGS